jgi:hypothetical protein
LGGRSINLGRGFRSRDSGLELDEDVLALGSLSVVDLGEAFEVLGELIDLLLIRIDDALASKRKRTELCSPR